MTLATDEFIRRFLIHTLPKRFHRIRHYGFLANGRRVINLAHARKLLNMPPSQSSNDRVHDEEVMVSTYICRSCEGPMIIIETLDPVYKSRAPPGRIAA